MGWVVGYGCETWGRVWVGGWVLVCVVLWMWHERGDGVVLNDGRVCSVLYGVREKNAGWGRWTRHTRKHDKQIKTKHHQHNQSINSPHTHTPSHTHRGGHKSGGDTLAEITLHPPTASFFPSASRALSVSAAAFFSPRQARSAPSTSLATAARRCAWDKLVCFIVL